MSTKGDAFHRLSDLDFDNRTGTCSICGQVKIYFSQRWRCSIAHNDRSNRSVYKKRYGVDIVTRPKSCELCGGSKRIAYDHDHQSGKFRGWLCMKCNTALGLVNDDVELLQKMISYLLKDQ